MILRLWALLALLAATPAHAADITIPNLPPASAIADTDLFLKYDTSQPSGQRTQRVTGGIVATYVLGKIGNAGLSIGTVATLPAGSQATASVSGAFPNQSLNLGIPQGSPGAGSGTVSPSGAVTDGALTVFNGTTGNSIKAGSLAGIGAAARGANSDITALSGLTTALPIGEGGTGATSASAALTALGGAPLASPTFTGTPAVPTATVGTNTTQAASTAFVLQNAGAAVPASSSTKTGAYTVQSSDKGSMIRLSGSFALTGPAASNGFYFSVSKRDGSGAVTFTPATGTVDGLSSLTIYQEGFTFWCDGTNWFSIGRPRGWVELGTYTISGSPTVATLTIGFGDTELSEAQAFYNITHAGTSALLARFQKGGSVVSGSTYVLSGSSAGTSSVTTSSSTAGNNFPLDVGANNTHAGTLTVHAPTASGGGAANPVEWAGFGGAAAPAFNTGLGAETTASVPQGISFTAVSGAALSGYIHMRGFRP